MRKEQLKSLLLAYDSIFSDNQERMEKTLEILKARANPIPVNKITLDAIDDLQIFLAINKSLFSNLLEDATEACNDTSQPS